MANASAYKMISIPEAQAIVLEHTPVLPAETVSLHLALDRVLAETVTARDPLPPFPASIKARGGPDGSGLRFAFHRMPRGHVFVGACVHAGISCRRSSATTALPPYPRTTPLPALPSQLPTDRTATRWSLPTGPASTTSSASPAPARWTPSPWRPGLWPTSRRVRACARGCALLSSGVVPRRCQRPPSFYWQQAGRQAAVGGGATQIGH